MIRRLFSDHPGEDRNKASNDVEMYAKGCRDSFPDQTDIEIVQELAFVYLSPVEILKVLFSLISFRVKTAFKKRARSVKVSLTVKKFSR